MPESNVSGKPVNQKIRWPAMRKLLNPGASWYGSKACLVCRLASPITGLFSLPVVGLSLENKGFSGKRKIMTIFLVRCFRRGRLALLPRATKRKPQNTMTTLDFYKVTEYYSVGGTPRTVGNYTDRVVARHIANGIAGSRKLTLVYEGSIPGEGFKARWGDSKGNIGLFITTETLTIQSPNA